MALDALIASGATEERSHEALRSGLRNEEGIEVLHRALDCGVPHILVSTLNLERLLEDAASPTPAASREDAEATDGQPAMQAHPRPSLSVEYEAPRNDVERVLAGIWAEMLGIEKVGIHDNFFELGGDSLLNVQVTAIAKRAGLKITAKQVFERQTIAELATAATEQARERFEL